LGGAQSGLYPEARRARPASRWKVGRERRDVVLVKKGKTMLNEIGRKRKKNGRAPTEQEY